MLHANLQHYAYKIEIRPAYSSHIRCRALNMHVATSKTYRPGLVSGILLALTLFGAFIALTQIDRDLGPAGEISIVPE